MMSEKVELLGKGCYKDIPDVLTLKSMPTSSELEYVGSEDFDDTMIHKILPECVEEDVNFENLLEIDYHWICRALRIINYGPYHTTNAIYCSKCGATSRGEYQVDLQTIPCNPLPEGFTNHVIIPKDEFIEFSKEIHMHMITIQESLNAYKDTSFHNAEGMVNRRLARLCYMINQIGDEAGLTPIQVKLIIQDQMGPADYEILKEVSNDLTDYGLRVGGSTICPVCKSNEATFFALMNDKFFRPTLGDLRRWKRDRDSRKDDSVSSDKATAVRKNNR